MALPLALQRALARAQDGAARLGRGLQRVVLTGMLSLVYFVGIGLTRLLAPIFARRAIRLFAAPPEGETLWQEAEGYSADRARLERQF